MAINKPNPELIHSLSAGSARISAIINLLQDSEFCGSVNVADLDRDFRSALRILDQEWACLIKQNIDPGT